jgi:hypothetical protein
MGVILNGVRCDDWSLRPGLARSLGQALATRGQVAYCRVAPPAAKPGETEQRRANRVRLRLRSAKLLTADKRFLCECRVQDRSNGGVGLVLARNVTLPSRLCLYDDETGQAHFVTVAWRRDATIGVRFCASGAKPNIRPSERHALNGRYYAVPDR